MATLTTSWQIISADGFYDPSHYSQALEARYTSQSMDGNYTDIEIRVVNYSSSASYTWRTQSGAVNFTGAYNDSASCATYPNYVNYGQVMLFSSKRVYHNADGTKSINLGAHLDAVIGGTRYNSNPPITNIVIPKINRISPITNFTGNDVEGNFSATYTQYVPDYTQKLKIGISGGATLQTYDDYISGTNVTLNASSISAIETYMNANNANQVTLSAVIETYSGTTLIGTSSALTSVASFSNAEPTITYTEEETDAKVIAVLGTSGDVPVQNASKLKFTITPTAKHGATISSVIATHDTTYPATKVGNDYIVTIPIKTKFITISVTDNRGNFNAVVIAKSNLIEYQSVDISPNFTIKRINPTSSTIRFNLTARYYQQTFGSYTNAPHLYYKLNDNARVEIPSSSYVIDNTNHTLTLTNYDVADLLVYTSSGQFTLQLEDLLTTDEEGGTNGYVLKGIPTFEAGEHDWQVNGTIYQADQNGQNPKEIWELIYPIGSIYLSVGTTSPATLFGGTWEKIEDRVLLGSGTKYTLGNTGGNADMVSSSYLGIAGAPYGGLYGGQGQGNYSARCVVVSGDKQNQWGSIQYFDYADMNLMPPYLVINIWKRTA